MTEIEPETEQEREARFASAFSKGDRIKNWLGWIGTVRHYTGRGSFWIDYDMPREGAANMCDLFAMEKI